MNNKCKSCANWRPNLFSEPRTGKCSEHNNDTLGTETCGQFRLYSVGAKPKKPTLKDFER